MIDNEHSVSSLSLNNSQPKDLIMEIIDWVQRAHTKPMREAAEVVAITLVGGIAARAFNIDGAPLNQFTVLIGQTSTGKGAVPKMAGKLISKVAESVPAITSIKGMGYVASGQAIIKELADKDSYPHRICFFDEVVHDFIQMKNPRNVTAKTKEQVMLQLWSMAGKGNFFDPMGYSDRDKNTGVLESPAFTFAGTGTPDAWNEFMDEASGASGFLARLLVIESTAPIPPDNPEAKQHFDNPPSGLIEGLADLTATALSHAHNKVVHDIEFGEGAKEEHKNFSEHVRSILNSHKEGSSRYLWGRAAEKALRLSGARAVGINRCKPIVTIEIAQWATRFIDYHTKMQASKFETGMVGEVAGNEVKQLNAVISTIGNYFCRPFDDEIDPKYGGIFDMHRDLVITETYLSRRLLQTAAFKGPQGGTRALKLALLNLVEAADIAEIGPKQMQEKYGCKPKAYIPTNPYRFKISKNSAA